MSSTGDSEQGGAAAPTSNKTMEPGGNSVPPVDPSSSQQQPPPMGGNAVPFNYGAGMSHPSSQYPSRNGSPVMRPTSVASTGSTSSYHTATTANTAVAANTAPSGPYSRFHNSNTPPAGFIPHGQHHYAAPPNGPYNHPQGPGLIRPTGRYPMPPRSNRGAGSNSMHMVRSGRPTYSGGNTTSHPPPQYYGGPPPSNHHYPQQPQYGHMPPHYEYHQSNYAYPEQQQQHYHVPQDQHTDAPPPQAAAPSPMESDSENKLSKDNQTTDVQATVSQEEENEQEPAASSVSRAETGHERENQSATGNTDHVSDEATVSSQQKTIDEPDSGMRPDENQLKQGHHHSQSLAYSHQQQHEVPYGGNASSQHYAHLQGFHHSREHSQQHYHQQQQYPGHQPYGHQQHHGAMYGQHGAPPGLRYGNYHPSAGAPGGVSPPQQQAAMPYHPSEYQLGPSAAGHHGQHYTMHPQDHHYQGHHAYGAAPPPAHGAFQLPNYTARRGSYNPSPEPTVDAQPIRASPSPPPRPPVSSPPKKPALLDKTGKPIPGDGSPQSNKTALGERAQNEVKDVAVGTKQPGKKEDATADAASILLQLCAPVLTSGEAENENPQTSTDENGQAKHQSIPHSVQGSSSMDEASEMTHPDLTSEPSHDSIEQTMQNRVLDTEFPCPIPSKYPTRLCLPYDGAKLNSLHCYLRSDLLEIFVVQKSPHKSPTHSPHSSIGRVGLRCVHCAMNHRQFRDDREDAPMAVFYPKSVAEIYRLVTSWQRCHLRKCRNLPPTVRGKWLELRESDKSRGKTHYWVTSAKEIGLRDCQGRAGGIRFAPDLDGTQLPPQTRPAIYSPEPDDGVAHASARPPRPPARGPNSLVHQDVQMPIAPANYLPPPPAGEMKLPPHSRMKLPLQHPKTDAAVLKEQCMVNDPPGSKIEANGGTPQQHSKTAGTTIAL